MATNKIMFFFVCICDNKTIRYIATAAAIHHSFLQSASRSLASTLGQI
jgi:hypothetical protein